MILVHGFTLSLASWHRSGYVAALGPRYRLILIDARGHGESDKPHDPSAYTDEYTVADVIAVLDAVGIERAHFFGYSMGGHIGYACAQLAPARFASFVIGGYSPRPWPAAATSYTARLSQDMNGLLAWWEATFGPPSEQKRAALLETDSEALIAMLRAVADHPGFIDLLPTMRAPTLVYCGAADPILPGVEHAARLIPGVTSVVLPALDHVAALGRIDLVLPHVLDFLAAHPLEG